MPRWVAAVLPRVRDAPDRSKPRLPRHASPKHACRFAPAWWTEGTGQTALRQDGVGKRIRLFGAAMRPNRNGERRAGRTSGVHIVADHHLATAASTAVAASGRGRMAECNIAGGPNADNAEQRERLCGRGEPASYESGHHAPGSIVHWHPKTR